MGLCLYIFSKRLIQNRLIYNFLIKTYFPLQVCLFYPNGFAYPQNLELKKGTQRGWIFFSGFLIAPRKKSKILTLKQSSKSWRGISLVQNNGQRHFCFQNIVFFLLFWYYLPCVASWDCRPNPEDWKNRKSEDQKMFKKF